MAKKGLDLEDLLSDLNLQANFLDDLGQKIKSSRSEEEDEKSRIDEEIARRETQEKEQAELARLARKQEDELFEQRRKAKNDPSENQTDEDLDDFDDWSSMAVVSFEEVEDDAKTIFDLLGLPPAPPTEEMKKRISMIQLKRKSALMAAQNAETLQSASTSEQKDQATPQVIVPTLSITPDSARGTPTSPLTSPPNVNLFASVSQPDRGRAETAPIKALAAPDSGPSWRKDNNSNLSPRVMKNDMSPMDSVVPRGGSLASPEDSPTPVRRSSSAPDNVNINLSAKRRKATPGGSSHREINEPVERSQPSPPSPKATSRKASSGLAGLFKALKKPNNDKQMTSLPENVESWSGKIDFVEANVGVWHDWRDEPNTLVNYPPDIAKRWSLETGNPALTTNEIDIHFIDDPRFITYYQTWFYGKPHASYVALKEEKEGGVGPVVLSVETSRDKNLRVLLRTKNWDERVVLPTARHKKKTLGTVLPYLAGYKLIKIDNRPAQSKTFLKLQEDLLRFENHVVVRASKIGILYWKTGQEAEDDFYCNVQGSADYEEFLSFMGEKVPLLGWPNFKGGLNIKDNCTGTHSIYTKYKGHEIMFHVSTMIPFTPNDKQQVERKRHLGNDVVVILFRDSDNTTPFEPSIMASQVNHIFLLIQADRRPEGMFYRVALFTKKGVPMFEPSLPKDGVFPKNDFFRTFLMTKLINAERAALRSPEFAPKYLITRNTLLRHVFQDVSGNEEPTSPSTSRATPKTEKKKSGSVISV